MMYLLLAKDRSREMGALTTDCRLFGLSRLLHWVAGPLLTPAAFIWTGGFATTRTRPGCAATRVEE